VSVIYGPVPSWRLGRSLGVDVIEPPKKCTFNCIYCQLGRTVVHVPDPEGLKEPLVSPSRVLQDLDEVLERIEFETVDTVTFSGCGEPTLNLNLGEIAEGVRSRIGSKPMTVLTNASLVHRADIRRNLIPFDLVVAKLDAGGDETLRMINRPADEHLSVGLIVDSIKVLKREITGRVALEVMLLDSADESNSNVRGENLKELSNAILEVEPDLVQLEVPYRPPSESYVKQPPQELVRKIHRNLSDHLGEDRVWAYGVRSRKVRGVAWFRHRSVEGEVLDLLKRRPCRAIDISISLGLDLDTVQKALESLRGKGEIEVLVRNGEEYNSVSKRQQPDTF
jgi:wyosine [tRNA(Phe)-imidazoG37] synthetase (radical SAM superfamily)